MNRKKLIKSEIAGIFKVTKETLRHYEQKELLTPDVDANGYRLYGHNQIRRLRQILFLRDLEIPVDRIAELLNEGKTQEEYLSLLAEHYRSLQERLKHLREVAKNSEQLIRILTKGERRQSMSLHTYPERHFYSLNYPETGEVPDEKSYFDQFKSLIDRGIYTERSFQLVYPFEDLSSGQFIRSRQCVQVSDPRRFSREDLITFPEGDYLSVFYLYTDGVHEELPRLTEDIEAFLQGKGVKRRGETVLEIEHPELSLMYEDKTNFYELQISVETAYSTGGR